MGGKKGGSKPSKTETEPEPREPKIEKPENVEEEDVEDEKLREVLRGSGDLKEMVAKQQFPITNFRERLPAFKRFSKLLMADESKEVFRKFLITSMLMLFLPVSAFYISLDVFLSYEVNTEQAPVFAAIVALCSVQAISIGYVIMTCYEERELRDNKEKSD